MRKVIALLLCLLVFSFAFAHSGGTDANGGHHVTATGEYHYHHGKPAHDHPNGVCPYDTKPSSSSGYHNSSSGTSSSNNSNGGSPALVIGGIAAAAAVGYAAGKKGK